MAERSRMAEEHKPLWRERWFQITLGSLLLLTVASQTIPWLLGMVYALRSVLLPLVVALGLAYIFNPVVTWMQTRLRLPRAIGTGLVMLTAAFAVLILALLVLPPLIGQGVELIQNAKNYPQKISQLIEQQGPTQPTESNVPPTEADPSDVVPVDDADSGLFGFFADVKAEIELALGPEQANELLVQAASWLSQLDWAAVAQFLWLSLDVGTEKVGEAISATSYFVLSAVIIGFCFFFFSWKLDKLGAWFVPFIPVKNRNEVLAVVRQMDRSVAGFIRGRLVQAGVMALILSIGWKLAGVPSWLLLGVLSGLLNLVPFAAVVGFLAALALAVVDSVAGGGFGLSVLIWPTLVYVIAQLLDGWVVEPIVQGKATDLDPVSVLVAVMIGGALAGLLGMLIAIPTAACVKIVSREVVLPRLRALAAGEDYPPVIKS